eukprot:6770555-Heterocapsa_arctica.AAC.1
MYWTSLAGSRFRCPKLSAGKAWWAKEAQDECGFIPVSEPSNVSLLPIPGPLEGTLKSYFNKNIRCPGIQESVTVSFFSKESRNQ